MQIESWMMNMNKRRINSLTGFRWAVMLLIVSAGVASADLKIVKNESCSDPKSLGDRVLAGLNTITLPTVKGAHDSDFCMVAGKAYVVYEANDVQPGENPEWPFIYCALTIADMASGKPEQTVTFAASEMKFANETLPVGACMVPKITPLDNHTLRCFFTSEQPGKRQSQIWYRDFYVARASFDANIHRVELGTVEGVFPMQPQYQHRQAVAEGFPTPPKQHGLYMIDSFKMFDGRWHGVLNNFATGLMSWTEINPEWTRFTILGNIFQPAEARLSEASVNRLPDGTWLAIARQENRNHNYMFTRSQDGRHWTTAEYWPLIPNGMASKPTFDRFGDLYYLGWQESTKINGAFRSVFNIDVSRDGRHWERKYRFETDKSFQYPTFREYNGAIYLTVTQGDTSDSRKERIMFGRLE